MAIRNTSVWHVRNAELGNMFEGCAARRCCAGGVVKVQIVRGGEMALKEVGYTDLFRMMSKEMGHLENN